MTRHSVSISLAVIFVCWSACDISYRPGIEFYFVSLSRVVLDTAVIRGSM